MDHRSDQLIARGLSNTEIAQHLHVTIGTVKTRMHRAMHNLRDALDDLAELRGLAAGAGGDAADQDRGAEPGQDVNDDIEGGGR